jgi:hypothetical protein
MNRGKVVGKPQSPQPRPGRPRSPNPRSKRIPLNVTASERADLELVGKARNLGISLVLREMSVNDVVKEATRLRKELAG